jgi:hypothetical protein
MSGEGENMKFDVKRGRGNDISYQEREIKSDSMSGEEENMKFDVRRGRENDISYQERQIK